ncbi:MAG TPA: HNH endonuclease [Pirellulaceae bacterium]|nr:HNH endonuclease [Pirellulaceae bacterium]
MPNALFINGIFDVVLREIVDAQMTGAGDLFLQPFKKQPIKILRDSPPDESNPVRLYVSTTDDLSHISYVAEIVAWDNKKDINQTRRKQIASKMRKFQSEGELKLFLGTGKKGQGAINLITVRNLRRLGQPQPVSVLIKVSNSECLKPRTQPGGWSPVYDVGDFQDQVEQTEIEFNKELEERVKASGKLSDAALKKRLQSAKEVPEKIRLIATGYKRNPDVIVAVLRRANGTCESCRQPAPFVKKSDGSPYLEVHHWVPLSKGGKDTVANAGALCPNCHREKHFGT